MTSEMKLAERLDAARSEMTELVEKLRREADERDRAPEHFDQALTDAMRAAASALERLERERDEQRVMFLYEADKHSEWLEKFMDMKRRAEAAEAREKRLREALAPFTRLSAWHGVSVTAGEVLESNGPDKK